MTLSRSAREWVTFGLVTLVVLVILLRYTRVSGTGEINWAVLVGILMPILIYGLFTLGLNLQFGFTGLVNFGHVASLLLGAYVTAILSLRPGGPFPTGFDPAVYDWPLVGSVLGQPPLVAALGGIVAAVVFGLLVGLPTLRLREDYLAILTISAAEILRTVLYNESEWTGGVRGLQGAPRLGEEWVAQQAGLVEFAARYRLEAYTLFLAALLLLVILLVFVAYQILTRAPYGRVLKAIRDDEDAASALGKNVFLYKLQALVLGGIVGAMAGSFFAWMYQNLIPTPDAFGPVITFYAYVAMVLGGAGNNRGTLLGAIVLWGLIFEGTRYIPVYQWMGLSSLEGPPFRLLTIGMLLIALIMLRPEGILGRKEEQTFGK